MDLSKLGGPQVHIFRIIEGLRQRGHHVRTVRLTPTDVRWSDDLSTWHAVEPARRWRPWLRVVERPVRLVQTIAPFLPYFNYFDSLRFCDMLCEILADVNVLYERYNFMSLGGVLASRRLRVPLLLEVNGEPFRESELVGNHLPRLQRRASWWLTRHTFSAATRVLPSGYGWQASLRGLGLLSSTSSTVVWPGVDTAHFSQIRHRTELRSKWAIVGDPVVVYCGSFDPWQGLPTLISAFSQLTHAYPDARLVLIGAGLLYEQIVSLAECQVTSGHIRFLGPLQQSDVAEVLSACDIGVSLIERRAEYVPMKLFDYMASGLAIVATAPDRRHDLLVNGETGLLIEPSNQEQLLSALACLGGDANLRRRLGQAARAQALAHHRWSDRAEQIEAIAISALSEQSLA